LPDIAGSGYDNHVLVKGILHIRASLYGIPSVVSQAQDLRAVVYGPAHPALNVSVDCRVLCAHGQNLCPRCEAESSTVGRDQTRHLRTMTINILTTVSTPRRKSDTGKDAASEVRVTPVNPRIDHTHNDVVAKRVPLSLGNIEKGEMPLGLANRISRSG